MTPWAWAGEGPEGYQRYRHNSRRHELTFRLDNTPGRDEYMQDINNRK